MPGVISPYGMSYERVPSGSTLQPLGGVGARGDYLDSVLIEDGATATSTIDLFDGGVLVANLMVASAQIPASAIPVHIGAVSKNGPWQITTSANANCVGIGIFSA